MSYTLDIKKIFNDLRGPQGLEVIKTEGEKIKAELKHLGETYRPQAKAKLKELEQRYKVLIVKVQKAQGEFEKEAKKTMSILKNLTKTSIKGKSVVLTKKKAVKKVGGKKVAKKASKKI